MAGLVVAVVALFIALPMLAAHLVNRHLADAAQHEWSALRHDQAIWQWPLQQPDDLIAGRAFGQASASSIGGALAINSTNGTPFELGLPIDSGLDLAHWPVLTIDLAKPAPPATTVALLWRDARGATCLSAPLQHLPPDHWRIDLRHLSWEAMSGSGAGCRLPNDARMLRLRVSLPAASTLQLRRAGLAGHGKVSAQVLNEVASWPTRVADPVAWLRAVSERSAGASLLRLPAAASARQLLQWRDQVRAVAPAALILPASLVLHANPAPASAQASAWLDWVALGLYCVALIGLSVAPRRRPVADGWIVAGALAGPLWLIAGLQLDPHPGPAGLLAFAAATAFAALAERRSAPRTWRWIGEWRRPAWWLPLLAIPLALLLQKAAGHTFEPLLARHVLLYFGWAVLQQWLILAVVQTRISRLSGNVGLAIVYAALAFALLHTPNGALMQLCFGAELYWAWCFQRSRSLLPVALAHAASALILEAGLAGGPWLRSLEVGTRFFS